MAQALYLGTDSIIEVPLTDARDDSPLIGATVTLTLEDEDSVQVTGQTWPATAIEASPGLYHVWIDDAVDLVHGVAYRAVIDVVAADGAIATATLALVGRKRRL